MMFRIGRQHARRTENSGHDGGYHPANTQQPGNLHGMQGASAAKGYHGQSAWVAAPLDHHGTDGARHVHIRHAADAMRGGKHVQAQYVSHMRLHGATREFRIDYQAAASQRMSVDRKSTRLNSSH